MNDGFEGNYAEVNGLRMYYEIHGSGDPLILLHGGVGAIEMFGEVLPLLAEGRQVVAVELQAHGRRRPPAERRVDGGRHRRPDCAPQLRKSRRHGLLPGRRCRPANRHPEVAHKLVVVSTPFRRDGWYPEVLVGMGQMGPEAAEPMKQTPMYWLYASVAPRPEDWPVLLTKLGELLRQDYD